jgi:hypothetical protein
MSTRLQGNGHTLSVLHAPFTTEADLLKDTKGIAETMVNHSYRQHLRSVTKKRKSSQREWRMRNWMQLMKGVWIVIGVERKVIFRGTVDNHRHKRASQGEQSQPDHTENAKRSTKWMIKGPPTTPKETVGRCTALHYSRGIRRRSVRLRRKLRVPGRRLCAHASQPRLGPLSQCD